jgi:hypothetical protein
MLQSKPTLAADEIPIASPPYGAFPSPPVETSVMSLPFGELTWENFERLCYRLAAQSTLVEHTARYGRQGQPQQGIDIFARKTNGRYEVWQAKRYRTFTAAQLKKAVKAFVAGTWLARSDKLVIAVQANLDDVRVQEEIENQTKELAKRDVALVVLGGDRLTEEVRPHQGLVSSFFGRGWLKAFYGDAVDPSIVSRLDGEEFARVRAQVARLYNARYSALDQGIVAGKFAGSSSSREPVALLDRYSMPDVYIRDRVIDPGIAQNRSATGAPDSIKDDKPFLSAGAREQLRRVPVNSWLADADHIALVADAGAGKSTLLRCIALDLMGAQTAFPALCARWSDRLPIMVSFAKWARATADKGGEVALKELVAQSLQPLLTVDLVALVDRAIDENRIVLFVDGLDEWSAEQAARLTLQTLLTYVEVHQVPTIASGRPLGLRKIGTLPQSWRTAELAPLSHSQQRELAQIWFQHLLQESPGEVVPSTVASWRTERFLKELQGERALGDLAETPLLFVGLLALAVRGIALPRNRTQAFQSLIRLLLEVHPDNRATAAGDVSSRFAVAAAPELRQSALGALAFASRRDGGDAGYSRSLSRTAIQAHLVSANGYDTARAGAVVDEILAVNAETIGLVVEKGPDDIGFAHASLEEYLSAVHIQGWRLEEILTFVRSKAGDPRWRTVIRNLVALNTRTSEIDKIVEVIEAIEPEAVDVLGVINRRRLLAEITFTPSAMASGTARRLAGQTFELINGLGPEVERVALLRLALNGLSDPILHETVEEHVNRWAPRRLEYTRELYNSLHSWNPDETLLDILIAGLGDENRDGSRAAARVITSKFSGSVEVGGRLRAMISGNSNISIVAAALEALVRGWPGPDTDALVNAARISRSPLLRAVAIWARVVGKIHDDNDRKECLQMVSFWSPLDYFDRSVATEALFDGWPDDDGIVADALQTLGSGPPRGGTIDRDMAVSYLLQSPPGRPTVDAWILNELERDHPFVLLGSGLWTPLVKFCEANPVIRERVITVVASGNRKYRERDVWELIAFVKDARLRDYAIERTLEKGGFGRYWSLLALVEGWADDPLVKDVFRSVIALGDDDLDMLAGLIPALYPHPADARARLIRVARDAREPRYDLIATAFRQLGIDGSDEEVVDVLLPYVSTASRSFWSADVVFALFGESPRLRQSALLRLQEPEPPIAQMARGMGDDPAVRAYVSDVVHAAPAGARSAIAMMCGTSADRHPALLRILAEHDRETNFQLRVQLAVDYYKLAYARGEAERSVARLIEVANRRGPDYEENRATGFAGLVAVHAAGAIIEGEGATMEITLGSYHRGGVSSALCSLVVENWDELRNGLGEDFAESRLKTFDGPAWESLSRFVASNPSARADFIAWCGKSNQIGLLALRALSEVAPKSDILLKHARMHIERPPGDSNGLPTLLLAAAICRDYFNTGEMIDAARERFLDRRDLASTLILAVLAPEEPLLKNLRVTALQVGVDHNEWFAAVEMAARLEPAEKVVEMIHAVANRRIQSRWGRGLTIEALIDRTIRDAGTRALLRESLDTALTPSAFCATASILSAAGALDSKGLTLCFQKLAEEQASQNLPEAVLDVGADEVRPLSHVLTDLILASSSL